MNNIKLNKVAPYIAYSLLKKLSKNDSKLVLLTWSRESTVLPLFLDKVINIYNGKKHFPIRITKSFYSNYNYHYKTFHKLGEFCLTRFFKSHKIVEIKLKKKKK